MIEVRRSESYDEAAAAAVGRVVDACATVDGRPPLDEAARLHLQHRGLTGSALWLADAGFALVRSSGDGDAARRELDLAVAPARRRTGVGRALLAAALAGDARRVTAWSHGDHPGAAVLAAATGFRRTRELMVLTADRSEIDTGTAAGPSVGIRSWRPADRDELLRVNAAAFAHHPEQGALDAAGLAERMAEPWFDPAGLLVAEADGRLVGFHWTKVHKGGQGEVYVLGVDPAAQGTGLGRTLAVAGLRHLVDGGASRVHLYVESDNASALRLYRGLGFSTDHTHVQYARP